MPQSRKRPGHHEYKKPGAIPAKQRVKGRTILMLLFAVFGLLIALFAAYDNYMVLAIGTLVGGAIGYVVGKNMEKAA
jgi:1,4-dihydroxy-2-naphthoate octaprenyltransferase